MSLYSQTILQDSPLAYWRLGELSGTSAADVQGAASGTYSGTLSLGLAGAIVSDNNASSSFAGGNVALPNVAALNLGASSCTLECWLKTGVSSFQHLIGGYDASSPFHGYALGIGAVTLGKVGYWSGGGNGNAWFESASSVSNGVWRHLAVTVSPTSTAIYIDGALDASLSADLRPTSFAGTRCLAARSDGVTTLSGMLDEVAVYGVSLSAARIAAHYQAGIASGMLARRWGRG
jgi:hypothetical protein